MAASGPNPKKRNGLAGTTKGTSKSAKYFQTHPEAKAKKDAYNTEFHKSKERKKYRETLNKKNRDAGTYGNGDNKDMSHTSNGKMIPEKQSTNRARNGKGDNKRLKSTKKKS